MHEPSELDWLWTDWSGDVSPAAAADAEEPRSGGPASAAAQGGTFSVTRPAIVSLEAGDGSRVLLAGIDTLDFGVFVEFEARWPKIVAKLAQLKQSARQTGGALVAGGRCMVLPGGKPNYPFQIQYPGFQLYLSRKQRPEEPTPNVYVSVNAQTLWHLGERDALTLVLTELAALAPGEVRECRMSRCDLTADLLLPGGLTEGFLKSHAVGQSQSYVTYVEGDRLQTFYVGSQQSPVQLRIYDKSLEIAVHDKAWFLPLWGLASNGYVWRVEFQLRRAFLKSCHVNSLDDLLTRRADLWAYLTVGWFSLRNSDNSNASRRTVHPLWELVQSASARWGDPMQPVQRAQRSPSRETSHLVKQAASLLVGFGARRQNVDLETVATEFLDALRQQFSVDDYAAACQRKALQMGINLFEDDA